MFSRDRQEASASIVLKVRGKLSSGQVAAIQHLVAAAVPDLNPSRVSVVDDQGNLLARGDGDASTALTSSNAEEMRVNYENRVARSVEQLLERSVGAGKARVDVHAEMNFDRITTSSETYDPDGQVVRSTQTDNQSDTSGSAAAGAAVSVSTNLPNGQTAPAPSSGSDNKQSKSTHTQETVNYEISKTVKNQVSDQGTVKRLSVAVLVDGTTAAGTDGKATYKARSADELKQLTSLVRSAVGYDEKRGDTVEVVNMPFAGAEEPPARPAPWSLMGLEKSDLLYLGTTAGTALIGLLILMLVIKPMIGRFLATAKDLGSSAAPAFAAAGAPATALPPPQGTAIARTPPPPQGEMIDIGQVEGRVAASSIKKIGEIVDKHPDEAVAIVRSWMYQDN
jgi:flagellar M-ring protein FliF